MVTYTLSELRCELFLACFVMSDWEREQAGPRWVIAHADRSHPCRMGLRDAAIRQLLAGHRSAYIMAHFAARMECHADVGEAA